MTRVAATRTLENGLRKLGFNRVCGVDEVGRGCLAGPVVAGAVVLHPDRHIAGSAIRKPFRPLSAKPFEEITARALAWGSPRRPPRDRYDQHPSGVPQAMRRAVMSLAPCPIWSRRRLPHSQFADGAARVVHGDQRCSAIAAASIVAKVTRDRQMRQLHVQMRVTGRTRQRLREADHLAAVRQFGYSTCIAGRSVHRAATGICTID